MRELHANGIHSNKTLHDTIAHFTIEEISSVLEGTAASKHVDKKAEKTALAVLTTVQNKLRAFRYLPDSGTQFSIRDWVSRPEEDSWIFLSLREEQKTTIEPLITLWFSIFIKAVMNLEPIHRELLWMYCDESQLYQKWMIYLYLLQILVNSVYVIFRTTRYSST